MVRQEEKKQSGSRRENLAHVAIGEQTNAGLWLEKYSRDISSTGNNAATIEAITKTVKIPPEYKLHYERWERELKQKEHAGQVKTAQATVQGRLVVGLGAESILETAIALHRTYGVPFIPGSALKGLASAAAHRFLANDEWRKKTKTDEQGPSHEVLFGNTKTAGFVTFHDALLVPENDARIPLDLDVMTVHHRDYYGTGKAPPADWDSPNPVSFVTARGTYLIALEGPAEWTKAALDILQEALWEEGIGAKTAAGYGRLRVEGYTTREEREEALRVQNEHNEKQRQQEEKAKQARMEQAQAWKKSIEMGNASQRVQFILDNVKEIDRTSTAKEMINKLTPKSLKTKRDKSWVQELFKAAGEPLP
jgi:CRISPR-associated protein Cmr6